MDYNLLFNFVKTFLNEFDIDFEMSTSMSLKMKKTFPGIFQLKSIFYLSRTQYYWNGDLYSIILPVKKIIFSKINF